jgi:hypothetical protein
MLGLGGCDFFEKDETKKLNFDDGCQIEIY